MDRYRAPKKIQTQIPEDVKSPEQHARYFLGKDYDTPIYKMHEWPALIFNYYYEGSGLKDWSEKSKKRIKIYASKPIVTRIQRIFC